MNEKNSYCFCSHYSWIEFTVQYMYVGFICILSKINALKDNKGQNEINMHA